MKKNHIVEQAIADADKEAKGDKNQWKKKLKHAGVKRCLPMGL